MIRTTNKINVSKGLISDGKTYPSTTLRYQNFDRDSATLRSRVLKDCLIIVLELFSFLS